MSRRHRPRPRVWLRLGCAGCSLPVLLQLGIAIVVLVVMFG